VDWEANRFVSHGAASNGNRSQLSGPALAFHGRKRERDRANAKRTHDEWKTSDDATPNGFS
jgi:hypothetical protein